MTIHSTKIPGQHLIKLAKDPTKKGHFIVKYGQEVKTGLTYLKATEVYGAALFHALTCAGRMD